MGKKALQFSMGLALITILLQIVAMIRPLAQVSFFTSIAIVPAKVVTLKTYCIKAEFQASSNDICHQLKDRIGFCSEKGADDLLDVKERFCAGSARTSLPAACTALDWAHLLGILLLISVALNVFVLGISIFLMHHYIEVSPKKKYREVALILVSIGALVITAVLGMYWPNVVIALSSMKVRPPLSLMADTSRGSGVADGFPLLIVSILFQVMAGVLCKMGKTHAEKDLKEAREQMKFEAEMAACAGLVGLGTELAPGGQAPGSMYAGNTGSQIGFSGSVGGDMMSSSYPMQYNSGYQSQAGASYGGNYYGGNPYASQGGFQSSFQQQQQQQPGVMQPAW